MKSLSYTRSITLTSSIQKLDELHKQLLLIPLSPANELQIQWESANQKIQYLLALGGRSVAPTQISDHLLHLNQKSAIPYSGEIDSYRIAFDYLYHHWLVNPKVVEPSDLGEFFQSIFPKETFTGDEAELKASLQYIQINPEHPIIQASLAQILILSLSPYSAYNEQFAHLVFLLFMYKYGYDMRRLPVYEEQYVLDITNYKNMILQSNRLDNVTPWLEYVCERAVIAVQKTVSMVQQQKHNYQRTSENLFSLNERQEHIMNLFSVPGAKISNRVIQKKCKVSQITASRDLAKLADSGLIFAIGKGRSTYYTKV
jgi:DNA-binding transcriptional ArsR family regulator